MVLEDDYLFLLMLLLQVLQMLKQTSKTIESIFFQDGRLKNIMY